MKEGILYEELENKRVRCNLCPHRCIILPSKLGVCGVRKNIDGKLYSLNYGKLVAQHIDPIEKKPLFHFYPGSRAYSIATAGCNFKCLHCQNYTISQIAPKDQREIYGEDVLPESVVDQAESGNCKSIAYTYTEPIIFFEYAMDVAVIAKSRAIKNIFVTNGYITEEALQLISPYLDAANVDLKSFSEKFYKKVCKARLKPVLESIEKMKGMGIWLEITTLIIPGYNDSKEELMEIAKYIKNLDSEIPWHVTRFYPAYKMVSVPPTPAETLRIAYEIGKETGLSYVYQGNIGSGEDTYCPECGKLLIRRYELNMIENKITNNHCPFCGREISGVGL